MWRRSVCEVNREVDLYNRSNRWAESGEKLCASRSISSIVPPEFLFYYSRTITKLATSRRPHTVATGSVGPDADHAGDLDDNKSRTGAVIKLFGDTMETVSRISKIQSRALLYQGVLLNKDSNTVVNLSKLLKENENIFIPKGAIHRLANNNDVDLIVIEMWYGDELNEDDIKRYDDIYERI